MNIPIIYTDPDIIVVNKPSGIAVHGGAGITGETIADFLLARFPELRLVGDDPAVRPGIVHRLDRDTSGVMLVARTPDSFAMLKLLFQRRMVEKIYRAIVCGTVRDAQGLIQLPIGRLRKNPVKRGVAVGKKQIITGARDAITEYRLVRAGKQYSEVELRPRTGRMHQLRVHLAALAHPIACDTRYGGNRVCCPPGVGRQLLHALSIALSMRDGQRLLFVADFPEDFLLARNEIL